MIVEVVPRGSAYIRYRIGETVVGPQDEIGSEVIVDRNAQGQVIGIEIIDVAIDESVVAARAFATAAGLPFPASFIVPAPADTTRS